jgi:hypothetical protein
MKRIGVARAVFVVGLVVLGALAWRGVTHHDTTSSVGSPSAAAPMTVAEATVTKGPPAEDVSSEHTPAGAQRAAIAIARAVPTLVSVPRDQAAALRRAQASDASSDALVTDTLRRYDALHARYPGAVTYDLAVLRARATAQSADEVSVALWYVGVLRASGLNPAALWGTETVDLVWQHDQWKIAADTDVTGPTPGLPGPASTIAELTDRLDGFNPVNAS